MKKRFAAFVSTVLAAVLCACSAAPKDVLPNKAAQPTEAPTQQAQTTQAAPTEQPTPEPDPVQQLLEEMTLEQKVGQLFLVRPDSLDLSQTQDQINDAKADGVTDLTDAMRQTLAEYPVGGVVIFGKNLESPQQITQFLDDLQQASDTPLFTAIDEEGGLVARLANNAAFDLPQYESAAAVGTSGNPEDARAMGRTIGGYLKEYGFNLDFAPVADVNTNPDNPVIGTRAFSSEPQTAADLVGGACAGFADAGIACTLKHFPGHGDTSEDTHVGTVTLNKTLDDLRSCELVPFAQNVNNAPLIMAAPKKIFVCSPYRPTAENLRCQKSQLEANIDRAKTACRILSTLGFLPLAPHLYFTQFLKDEEKKERETGMKLGLHWLEEADELWVFGDTVSEGMTAEIKKAHELNKPVRNLPEPGRVIELLLKSISEQYQIPLDDKTEDQLWCWRCCRCR